MPTFTGYVYNAGTGLPYTSGQHWKIDADAFVGSQSLTEKELSDSSWL